MLEKVVEGDLIRVQVGALVSVSSWVSGAADAELVQLHLGAWFADDHVVAALDQQGVLRLVAHLLLHHCRLHLLIYRTNLNRGELLLHLVDLGLEPAHFSVGLLLDFSDLYYHLLLPRLRPDQVLQDDEDRLLLLVLRDRVCAKKCVVDVVDLLDVLGLEWLALERAGLEVVWALDLLTEL